MFLELSGSEIAELGAKSALDRKANEVVILDLRGLSSIADYFVICSGNSHTHVEGISRIIEEKLDEHDVELWHREGERQSSWILLDYIDVIFHIFTQEAREFYGLERLWGDADRTVYENEYNGEADQATFV
jgi:ribosome-associated protein